MYLEERKSFHIQHLSEENEAKFEKQNNNKKKTHNDSVNSQQKSAGCGRQQNLELPVVVVFFLPTVDLRPKGPWVQIVVNYLLLSSVHNCLYVCAFERVHACKCTNRRIGGCGWGWGLRRR